MDVVNTALNDLVASAITGATGAVLSWLYVPIEVQDELFDASVALTHMDVIEFADRVLVVILLDPTTIAELDDIAAVEQPAALWRVTVPASLDVNDTLGVKVVPGLVVVTLALVIVGAAVSALVDVVTYL